MENGSNVFCSSFDKQKDRVKGTMSMQPTIHSGLVMELGYGVDYVSIEPDVNLADIGPG